MNKEAKIIKLTFKNYPWIAMLGAFLIFLSWILQNYFNSSRIDEKLQMNQTQMMIDLQQIRFEHWQSIYIIEKRKIKPDTTIMLGAIFKTLQSYQNLVAWSAARVNKSDEKVAEIINLKNLTQVALAQLYQSRNLNALETDLSKCIETENATNFSSIMTDKFVDKYSNNENSLRIYSVLFLISYIIGSLLIGLDFMIRINNRKKE
ncbi:MAG: hypothetical protein NTW49_11725 [Bacteroidia bacterium]|nr:hypothetical protein [Bacteroidia bacterium]